jgi:hypothetical protein
MTTELDRPAIDVAMEEVEALLADSHTAQTDDGRWLAPWYLRKLAELDAAEAMIDEQAKRMKSQIGARRKALEWKWGEPFRAQVDADIQAQGGKKKSVDYLTGRAGYRAVGGRPKVTITDEAQAIAAAERACPAAVKKSLLLTPLLDHVKATGEVLPGTDYTVTPKEERFYPTTGLMELTTGKEE